MAIIGLESDYYCAHNPLPVEITGATDYLYLQIRIGGNDMLTDPPVFYPIGTSFKVDLSAWVRQFMAAFAEQHPYTDIPTVYANDYVRTMQIAFISPQGEQIVTRKFVHCALDSYSLSPFDDDCCIKVWKCYPFSAPVGGWDDRVMMVVDEEPELDVCGCIDYDDTCCRGVYLKWLNDKGYYSYWLFPNFKTISREGEEILRVPRNVFNPDRTSNEDTAGFDVTESIEVRDKIPAPYWDQLKTLVGSPEVYMLRPTWELGSNVQTSDWIRIIQDAPEFERNSKNNTADFEMTLSLPRTYTQKRI